MFSPTSLEDLALLRETVELECKLAQGQNGQGEVPKDFWPTYSAMANAHGGVVLLGVREKDGAFSIAGIANPAKVRADLFNNLNNLGKVSANLLTDADVQELVLGDKSILVVRIPQATRQQKPVFLNGQPLGHTYRRLNEGDRVCDDATVKRMQMIHHGQPFNWRHLKSTAAEMNIPPIEVFDANYGKVKAYHADVWREAYALEIETQTH